MRIFLHLCQLIAADRKAVPGCSTVALVSDDGICCLCWVERIPENVLVSGGAWLLQGQAAQLPSMPSIPTASLVTDWEPWEQFQTSDPRQIKPQLTSISHLLRPTIFRRILDHVGEGVIDVVVHKERAWQGGVQLDHRRYEILIELFDQFIGSFDASDCDVVHG